MTIELASTTLPTFRPILATVRQGFAGRWARRGAEHRPGPPPAHRFRILRPHAEGGLGEVFVARDEELHREVALKEIRDRFADDPIAAAPASCSRPRSPAAWSIPGIVPVYGLGHYADGRPYYAMRFIRGDSLKEAIERVPRADEARAATPASATLALRKLLRPVPRRLQRDRLRPQPGRAAPRPEAGQHHARQVRRDAGRRLGPGQGRRTGPKPVGRPGRAAAATRRRAAAGDRRCRARRSARRRT